MGRAGDFANVSAGHVHPNLDIPFAHLPRWLPAYPLGFPYVVDSQITRGAMIDHWAHLNETGYVSDSTA